MKLILALTLAAGALAIGSASGHAQTCSNASLNGKYILSGQGDVYTAQKDVTVSTTGYFVADGNGNITSARLFEADNSGVLDSGITPNAGSYSITDCDNGTVSLTFGTRKATFDIDPDNVDSSNLAHNGVMLDTDPKRNESYNLTRTVDPTGAAACGTGLNLTGLQTNESAKGHAPNGQALSFLGNLIFQNGTFSGTDKQTSPNGLTTHTFTGTYSIQSDCSVLLTRTEDGVEIKGAHIVSGGDPRAKVSHSYVWQGDYYGADDEVAALVIDNGPGTCRFNFFSDEEDDLDCY
jgi:hypothetical protein